MKPYLRPCLLVLLATGSVAASALAQSRPVRAAGLPNASAATAGPAKTLPLSGRVETEQGPLPGATVRLLGSGQTCVTNEAGSFLFAVPADAGPLAAAVSYPGCAEVSVTLQPTGPPTVVQMPTPVVTKADRKRLKPYLKTARRQTKRDLRQLR